MAKVGLPQKIIVASGNAHKIQEIGRIFSDVTLLGMKQAGFTGDIEETGASFKENALIKARAVSEALGCEYPVLADDSGLCVDALGGAPGIFSARFSGGTDADNRKLLLQKLANSKERGAHFCCAVCLYFPDGQYLFGTGETYGDIALCERGYNGFGYDSLFISRELKKTFGEATSGEKDEVSHRFRALRDLRSKL